MALGVAAADWLGHFGFQCCHFGFGLFHLDLHLGFGYLGDLLAGLSGFASQGSEAAEGSEDWPIGGLDVGVVALQVAEDLFGGGDSVQRHEDLFDGFGQGCGVVVVHVVGVVVGVGVGLIAHCCNHIIWICGENHVCIFREDVLHLVWVLPVWKMLPGELGEGATLVGHGIPDLDDAFLG